MRDNKALVFMTLILMIGLMGCAVNSGVISMGNDTYIVSRQAATGFSGLGNLKTDAMREAYTECQKKGKVVEVIEIVESQPPYVLGNFPRTDIRFKCVDPTANSESKSKEYIKSSGSGFFISSDGILATNAHVVGKAKSISVQISNDIGRFNYSAKLLLVDNTNDVALIKIDDTNFKGLSSIPYSLVELAQIGEKVFTIGYPLNDVMGSNYKVTDGIVSSTSGIADDLRYYQISVPLQPGNSGGPLFNKNGDVIGITASRLSSNAVGINTENVNYAIKISYLLNLYKMLPNSTSLSTTPRLSNQELQEHVKALKNYVCLININGL